MVSAPDHRLEHIGYNSLENPIGIETRRTGGRLSSGSAGYNSLENPIGIETGVIEDLPDLAPMLQLIRKPDRD